MVLFGTTTLSGTYLLMGVGRLVALLLGVLALSEPTDWRRGWWRSKHHTESRTQEWGLGVQVSRLILRIKLNA